MPASGPPALLSGSVLQLPRAKRRQDGAESQAKRSRAGSEAREERPKGTELQHGAVKAGGQGQACSSLRASPRKDFTPSLPSSVGLQTRDQPFKVGDVAAAAGSSKKGPPCTLAGIPCSSALPAPADASAGCSARVGTPVASVRPELMNGASTLGGYSLSARAPLGASAPPQLPPRRRQRAPAGCSVQAQPPTEPAQGIGAHAASAQRTPCTELDILEQSFGPALDSDSEELVGLICDVDMMKRQVEDLGCDTERLPLGKVSKDMVREGFTWLRAIELELRKPNPRQSSIAKLSCSFFDVVPCRSAGPIDTTEKLMARVQLLTLLTDVRAVYCKLLALKAGKALRKAATSRPEQQGQARSGSAATKQVPEAAGDAEPLVHQQHQLLACDLQLLSHDCPMWGVIQDYVRGSESAAAPGSHLVQVSKVFRVNRHGEEARYAKHVANAERMLLWRGSPLASWAGLLSQGLRAPLPEAPDVGLSFGKGLYFTDLASKATACLPAEGRCLLLLAEVALGARRELLRAEPGAEPARLLPRSAKCGSVFGRGSTAPDPACAYTLPNGVKVPLGPVSEQPAKGLTLPHNEYVVFDCSRVRARYIVEVISVSTSKSSAADGPLATAAAVAVAASPLRLRSFAAAQRQQ
uniref:Poly [ADP-ribose] polymerase n=1 Tax=Lingulaulax polyedra TaxID=160621 RepID=A0A516AG81_LINPO|nr:poly [ADP-ribose] polymerase 2 [Lingulodinium polyedra]